MMVRFVFLTLVLLLAFSLNALAATPPKPPAALMAAEAEKVIAQTEDFFLDLYVTKFDWNWHNTGDYPHMVELGYLMLDLDPHYIDMYTGSAWLLWSLKRHKEAEALYEEGMELNPKDSVIPMEMGAFYFLHYRKRPDLAVPILRRAVANGAGVNGDRALAAAYRKLERYQEELEVRKRIVKALPKDVNAKRHLEEVQAKLKEGSTSKGGR